MNNTLKEKQLWYRLQSLKIREKHIQGDLRLSFLASFVLCLFSLLTANFGKLITDSGNIALPTVLMFSLMTFSLLFFVAGVHDTILFLRARRAVLRAKSELLGPLRTALRLRYGNYPIRCLYCASSEFDTLEGGIHVTCARTGETVDKNHVCPDFEPDSGRQLLNKDPDPDTEPTKMKVQWEIRSEDLIEE